MIILYIHSICWCMKLAFYEHQQGATGHAVGPEVSLELILGDSLYVVVDVSVSLPPVYCSSKQLVCHR
jgi:hypothetical protein